MDGNLLGAAKTALANYNTRGLQAMADQVYESNQGAPSDAENMYRAYAEASATPGAAVLSTTPGGGYDPAYAAQQAATSASRNAFNTGRQSVYDSVGSATQNKGIEYNSGILDFLSSLKQGQAQVDTAAAKNELARSTGQAGVLGMVGRGIQSSGVTLANRNAGDSSAAGALANAYGQLGQRQMASVGNQYEMGNKDIALEQGNLDEQRNTGARKINESKQMYINDIVGSASEKFAQLNADAANASIPDRIAIEQEKESIRQQVISALQQYDQTLQTGMQSVAPTTLDQRRVAANQMRDAGTTLGQDMFNYTDQAPMGMQGGAPAGGTLPIYTMPRGRRTA